MSDSTQTPVDVFEKARTHDRAEQLEAAKQADLLPYFRLLTSQAGPVVEMEGRETVMLGSNNYLGLTGDPRVKQAARDALETYGTGLTGSRLMVDEAHAVGVLGARGAGTSELFGLEDRVDLRMGTFSKSLASCGGFIAGPADVIEYLKIASRAFMFTAAAVPAAVGAALEAVR